MACCQQVGKHVEDIGYKNSPIVLALLSNVCPSSRELIPRAKLYRKKHWKQQNFPKTSCRWHRKMQFRKKENLRLPEHYAYKFTGISFRVLHKSYICLKHRVTLRIHFHLVLWITIGPLIWPARSYIRNTFDRGVNIYATARHSPITSPQLDKKALPNLFINFAA